MSNGHARKVTFTWNIKPMKKKKIKLNFIPKISNKGIKKRKRQ